MNDNTPSSPDDQDLDVEGFAAKHNISTESAQKLIAEIGYDRGSLDAAAQKLKLDQR